MATMITSECINCGACEPECPNTAIYQGGVEWELDGAEHPPIATDFFYIAPEKCTECVGFFDHEACAAVCPVDCCIPNPDIPESEEVLIQRAKKLHPDTEFEDSFPSRFRAGSGEGAGAAPAEAPAAAAGAAAAAPEPAPAAAATASAVSSAPAKPAAVGGRVERPLSPPKPTMELVSAPPPSRPFGHELPCTYEEAEAQLGGQPQSGSRIGRWVAALAMPLLGALPSAQKQRIEDAVGDERFFSSSGATGLNVLHNMLIYPIVFAAVGALALGREVFSGQLKYLIALGIILASLEAIWRLREGFQARPAEDIRYRASLYGAPLVVVSAPLLRLLGGGPAKQTGTVGVDGFHSTEFEEKMERERRYGEVYELTEHANGCLLRMEFPRRIPPSAEKLTLNMPEEMPDYKIDIELENGYLVVSGSVVDPNVRKVAAVSPAFPPDFKKPIKLPRRVTGFKHRYGDKVLEVALLGSD